MVSGGTIDLTGKEHGSLLETLEQFFTVFTGFHDDIDWGDSQWLPDLELLYYANNQFLTVHGAAQAALVGDYRNSYSILRSVFEGFLLLALITVCDKFYSKVTIVPANAHETMIQAKERILQQIKERGLTIHSEANRTITLVRSGSRVVDENGQDTGRIYPIYARAWNEYRANDHHLRSIRDQLLPEWDIASDYERPDAATYSSEYYRLFFSFASMIENLVLNGYITEKQRARVIVHYNYLSGFTHLTSEALKLLPGFMGRPQFELSSSYSHYHSELCLLYAAHLLAMHLQHLLTYFTDWSKVTIRNRAKYEELVDKVEKDFGYFWFIFNGPHIFDRYQQANRISNLRKQVFIRPEQVLPENVGYYDDPFRRLKEMHSSTREFTTGNVYNSPFPRSDAR